jgi:hypothetical protein
MEISKNASNLLTSRRHCFLARLFHVKDGCQKRGIDAIITGQLKPYNELAAAVVALLKRSEMTSTGEAAYSGLFFVGSPAFTHPL